MAITIGDRYQTLDAIKTALKAATWTGGSQKVFAAKSVLIGQIDAHEHLLTQDVVLPMIIIGEGPSTIDPEYGEEPTLIQQTITTRIVAKGSIRDAGEIGIMGGNKINGATYSQGQGLEAIEYEVKRAIRYLGAESGYIIQWKSVSGAGADIVNDSPFVFKDLDWETMIGDTAV